MFAASRAVAEGDLQAAYRIACGAPRPMAVARHILELLKKLHPAPGDHLPEGQTPYGPPKRGVPKHIPITVDMSTLEIQIQIQIQNILVTQVKPATSC